jgi:hypothetical protein
VSIATDIGNKKNEKRTCQYDENQLLGDAVSETTLLGVEYLR